jgi:hypothetical protein
VKIGCFERLLKKYWESGASRTTPGDLAQRANRTEFLGGVQIGSPVVLNLAQPYNFVMMMKDFSGKEMKDTGEQHAHKQGACPLLLPKGSPSSQVNSFTLAFFWALIVC